MNIEQIKENLRKELIKDCTANDFNTTAQLVNFFYINYLNEKLFTDYKQYDYLLKSDRFQKDFFEPNKTIGFLISNRFDFLDFSKLQAYNIIK